MMATKRKHFHHQAHTARMELSPARKVPSRLSKDLMTVASRALDGRRTSEVEVKDLEVPPHVVVVPRTSSHHLKPSSIHMMDLASQEIRSINRTTAMDRDGHQDSLRSLPWQPSLRSVRC